jgi:hypothetical protein
MQDTELFIALAEIAGVFVGFGALIAIRSAGDADVSEVTAIGWVVWTGIFVIIMALAPVTLSRFGVAGHVLWFACTALALGLFWGVSELLERTWSERRAFVRIMGRSRWRYETIGLFTWGPAHLAFVVILLGLRPDLESALYFAAAVLFLVMDASILLMAVLRLGIVGKVGEPTFDEAGTQAGA